MGLGLFVHRPSGALAPAAPCAAGVLDTDVARPPHTETMAGKNSQARGKGKKRSLASRKREKDMSGAMLDNVYQSKPELTQTMKANWETALPRKMQIAMRAASGSGFRKAHREDLPREMRPNAKAAKRIKAEKAVKADAEAAAAGGLVGPVREPALAPTPAAQPAAPPRVAAASIPLPKPETAAEEARRKKAEAESVGAALMAGRKTGATKLKAMGTVKTDAAVFTGFGATNNQPPELKVSGRFGRIAALAAAKCVDRRSNGYLLPTQRASLLGPALTRCHVCVAAEAFRHARRRSPSSASSRTTRPQRPRKARAAACMLLSK